MKVLLSTIAVATALFSSSCASIVSHSRWPVAVSSSPIGATVVITNRRGAEVYSGNTPAAVSLKSGSGYFSRERYTLKFTMPGYETKTTLLEADINGWYFGNLLIGGALGMLIIDPATGAMYRLSQNAVSVAMSQTQGFNLPTADPNGLKIVSIDQVPDSQRQFLVPIATR